MPIMWGFRETSELRGSVIAVRSVTSSSVRLCECWGQAGTGLPGVALWACVTYGVITKQQTDGVWQCDVCVTWHWR